MDPLGSCGDLIVLVSMALYLPSHMTLSWRAIYLMHPCSCMFADHVVTTVAQELRLRWNQALIAGAKALGDAIERNISLVRLDISMNGLTDEGGTYMAKAMQNNSTLQVLTPPSYRPKRFGPWPALSWKRASCTASNNVVVLKFKQLFCYCWRWQMLP